MALFAIFWGFGGPPGPPLKGVRTPLPEDPLGGTPPFGGYPPSPPPEGGPGTPRFSKISFNTVLCLRAAWNKIGPPDQLQGKPQKWHFLGFWGVSGPPVWTSVFGTPLGVPKTNYGVLPPLL